MNHMLRFTILWSGIALIAAAPGLGADRPGRRATEARPDMPADTPSQSVSSAEPPCPAFDVPAGASRRAFIDLETGQLREPTPEEAAQLAATARAARLRALSQLQVVVHPDGSKSVVLKDAFMADLVARRNPDGSLSIECLPPGSRAAAKPPAAPAAPVLEEK